MPDAAHRHVLSRRAVLAQALLMTVPAWAQSPQDTQMPESEPSWDGQSLQLQTRDGDVYLSAPMTWPLPELVEDALYKGIPVHFVLEAELLRERWYWSDQVLMQAQRYMRLSFQPLTRRWRLTTGAQPLEDQAARGVLASTYDSLQEALAVMQRLAHWRLGPRSELPDDGELLVQLRFRIDLSHFPRPLQIGALGRSGWNLLVTQSQRVPLSAL